MAVTKNSYTAASGSEQGPYSYSFPVIADTDIKVSVNGVVKTVTTHYTLDTSNTRITFVSGQYPTAGDSVIVYRNTDEDPITNTFVSGSTIRSNELNDNFKQLLYIAQESDNQSLSSLGGTMQGTLEIGEDQVIKFEGATANANETTLTVVDPTADRTITLPNVTGTVVTTGDTGTVTSTMIADATIVNADIANTTITGSKLVNGTITSTQIAANTIGAGDIANNTITATQIAANTIGAGEIANNTITATQIANNTITATQIANSAVTTAKLGDNAVTRAKIVNDAIDSNKIADDSIQTEHIADANVTKAHLADNSVGTGEIEDSAVTTAKIASGAVTTAKIANANITHDKLAEPCVQAENVGNGTLTGIKIADNQIDSRHYIDGSIDTEHIADSQITNAKLGDNSVSTAKITDDAVTNAKIAGDAIDQSKIADDAVRSEHILANAIGTSELASNAVTAGHIADSSITTAKIADNAVTTAKIADAELTTLAGMPSGTASILADSTALTSTTAELNLLDGKSIVTTIGGGATDVQLPTAQAVNERVVELVTEVGGFVPIANETSFPSTNPDINDGAGTIVSIKALSSAIVCGSGVTTKTITNGAGSGNNITITGLTQNTTYPAGRGMLLETTATSGNGSANPPREYTYHRLTLDESGVADAQAAVDDFQQRYRVASSAPTSSLDDGDLYFDTTVNKMKVYNASSSSWDDVAAPGDFYISTFSESFDGSRTAFTVSNAPTSAQQLIISINGVIQKPNAGTGQPSEGFTLSSSTVTFSSAPPSGSDYYVVVLGSSVNIGTPSDNTVSTAKIQNGAVTGDKIATNLDLADNKKIRFGTGNDLGIYHSGTNTFIENSTGPLKIRSDTLELGAANGEQMLQGTANSAVNLYYDGIKKFETTSNGISVTGSVIATGNVNLGDSSSSNNNRFIAGASDDLMVFHDGTNSHIANYTGELKLHGANSIRLQHPSSGETYLLATNNAGVELYHNNSKKFETTSTGAKVKYALQIEEESGSEYYQFVTNSYGGLEIQNETTKVCEFTDSSSLDFPDDTKIQLGTGQDLKIYHDGSNSYINESGTGGLKLLSSGVHIKNAADNAYMAFFGSTGASELYFNGSKKFETTSTGVAISGTLTTTGINGNITTPFTFKDESSNLIANFSGAAAELYYNGSKKFETNTDGTQSYGTFRHRGAEGAAAQIRIEADEGDDAADMWRLVANTNGTFAWQSYAGGAYENVVRATGNAEVALYYDNSKKFETDDGGVQVTGFLQGHYNYSDSDWTAHDWHVLQSNSGNRVALVVEHSNDSQPYGMIIDFSDDAPDNNSRYFIDCTDSSTSRFKVYSDGDVWNHDDSYTGSDQTLKENIVDATPKLEDLKKLKVRNFNWKADYFPEKSKKKHLGFIAQEVEEVFPSLIAEHDIAPGAGKDDKHTPVMKKAIKQAWAPILVKALQEAVAKIETLETKVAALEAK